MEQQYASLEPLHKCVHSGFDRRDGSAKPKDMELVQAYTQQAVAIKESQAVRFLQAEYSLTTPLVRNSLLELRKAFRASQPYKPMPLCLPPLKAPILRTAKICLPSVTYSPTERFIFGHLLISIESFLASLSFLESLWDFAKNSPSIPALFCDAILQQDPYRDSHEIGIARGIMEHIDTHYASISREVNIELGSTTNYGPSW